MKKNWQKSMGMGIMAAAMALLTGCSASTLNTGAVNTGKTADTMSMEQKQEEPMMNNDNLHTIYLSVEGRNLFVVASDYTNYLDPESMGNPYAQPIAKSFIFGLNVNF